MSVTLTKSSDYAPADSPFRTRQWQNTVKLAASLYAAHGDHNGVILYEGLADNNLDAVRASLPRFVNYPTALPSQESVTDYAPFGDDVVNVTLNYSDGYSGTYAPGE